jgi:tetratricopeptide (TPR) repeat protein
MKYVDPIIKYLSGEMTREERGSFEQKIQSNQQLREEFEHASSAWELVRSQLQERDANAFRSTLVAAMEKVDGARGKSPRRGPSRLFILLPLAASIAILLAVYVVNRFPAQPFTKFYHPGRDPVLLAFNQGTRGETGSAISLFNQGNFEEARAELRSLLAINPQDQLAMLYLLLASMELNRADDALEMILNTEADSHEQLGQALTWYTSLALIEKERFEEAAVQLHPLVIAPGPYQSQARRLEKMLLK